MDETLEGKIAAGMRVALGALFLYAGAVKSIDPHGFAGQVENYRILAHAPSVALALYLPWLEILCGGCLIFKALDRGALLVTGTLMIIFTGALASAWARGLRISCGCFGSMQGVGDYGFDLFRDIGILACIVFLWRKSPRRAG